MKDYQLHDNSHSRGIKRYIASIIDEEVSAEDLIDPYTEDGINLNSFTPKDNLCPELFNENDEMRKEIRDRLVKIYKQALKDCGVKSSTVKDCVLVGSIVSYHYSTYSDIDLHIVVDMDAVGDDAKLAEKWLDKERLLWNIHHNYQIDGYDVELYFESIKKKAKSLGRYSIKDNKWINKPDKEKYVLDKDSITQKVIESVYKIDDFCDNRDIVDKRDIDDYLNKIYTGRKEGLSDEGEFSERNILFKVLRRTGHLQKLIDLSNQTKEEE